jgi:hypothetical protein
VSIKHNREYPDILCSGGWHELPRVMVFVAVVLCAFQTIVVICYT